MAYVATGYIQEGYIQESITVDWPNYEIRVPRAFMVQVQSNPSSIYQLNIDSFRKRLRDLEDDPTGRAWPITHAYNAAVESGGVTLAPVVTINPPYTITFEDDYYGVNLTGANSNIADRTNVNNVSVRSANSAGLQDLSTLLASAYNNTVCVDVENGQAGTVVPLGTRSTPVNNFTDALTLADTYSIRNIQIMRSTEISTAGFNAGYTFIGDNEVVVSVTINTAAEILQCTFQAMTIQGVMDGQNTFSHCVINDISYVNGFIFECALSGTITLGGGGQCSIFNCYTNEPNALIADQPTIDMGGTGNSLVVNNYSGTLIVTNYAGGGDVQINMSQGKVIIDSTVTAGQIIVSGSADVIDNSTGTAVITDNTINTSLNVLETISTFMRKLLTNRVLITEDDQYTTIYDDDKVTPIHAFQHSDKRNRTPL